MQFASRTRQQFVRLLALVKWAASAERVDKYQVQYKCIHMCMSLLLLLLFFYFQDLNLNILKIFFFSSLSLFQAMSTILDKQSMLFIDTADMLARMSRESLVKAR